MSASHGRAATAARTTVAQSGTLVAVLERRGRFLTAQPLFGPRDQGPRRRAAAGIVVSSRSVGSERARAGDLVLVRPSKRGSSGEVARVLGRPDVARDVIGALLLERGMPGGFDPAVEREARDAARRVAGDSAGRRDLRELPTFTVDPATARDFDDAISAERLPDGGTRVWVHIADVAAHVREGSLIDREAQRRATSVYVPGAVEPMLPHALSSDACSLLPGCERPAVTVELELDDARVMRSSFYRSLVRSDERLDYERVDRVFAGRESAAAPWGQALGAAREVAAALARRREERGGLVIDAEEPEFEFDEHGNVLDVHARAQTESHRLIEHLMIAANEAVAGLLEQRAIPCLYRVHERPDPQRIERLVEQLASLEVPTPPLPEPLSSTQAADLLGEISRLVERHVRRTGHGAIALESLVLRSLKQAYYSPRNLGHAGLHSPRYCHFTSPIRRYPDVICHRALLSAVGGGEHAPAASALGELGEWTSERERDAARTERDADDIARCFVLERVLYEAGPEHVFAGEVAGLIAAGAFVAFGGASGREDAPGRAGLTYEGMLPVRVLRAPRAQRVPRREPRRGGRGAPGPSAERAGEREWWELNEEATILRGERTGASLRLGDPIEVRVASVEVLRGRVDLLQAG